MMHRRFLDAEWTFVGDGPQLLEDEHWVCDPKSPLCFVIDMSFINADTSFHSDVDSFFFDVGSLGSIFAKDFQTVMLYLLVSMVYHCSVVGHWHIMMAKHWYMMMKGCRDSLVPRAGWERRYLMNWSGDGTSKHRHSMQRVETWHLLLKRLS